MLWTLLIALGLIKLVAASLMLWLPFRCDAAMVATDDWPRADADESPDDDGGSKVSGAGPAGPHPRQPLPRLPRRGGSHGGAGGIGCAPRPRVRAPRSRRPVRSPALR